MKVYFDSMFEKLQSQVLAKDFSDHYDPSLQENSLLSDVPSIPEEEIGLPSWKSTPLVILPNERSEEAIGALIFLSTQKQLQVDSRNRALLPIAEDALLILKKGEDFSLSSFQENPSPKAFYMPLDSPAWRRFFIQKELKISAIPVHDKDLRLGPMPKELLKEDLLMRERCFKLLQSVSQMKALVVLSEDLSVDANAALATIYANQLAFLEAEFISLLHLRITLREKVLLHMPSSLTKASLISSHVCSGNFLFDDIRLHNAISLLAEKKVQIILPKTWQGQKADFKRGGYRGGFQPLGATHQNTEIKDSQPFQEGHSLRGTSRGRFNSRGGAKRQYRGHQGQAHASKKPNTAA
jgi:hypothetical protein